MNRIKELRVAGGLKQKDLAQVLGVKQNTLSTWETGRYEPDAEMLKALASFFNTTTDYILGNGHSKESPAAFDERISSLLQEPLMQEIHDVLIQLKPETQEIILAQMRAARDAEAAAKRKTRL